jgi:hypothetical protein
MKEYVFGFFAVSLIVSFFVGYFAIHRQAEIEKQHEVIITNDSIIIKKLDTVVYKLDKVDTVQN